MQCKAPAVVLVLCHCTRILIQLLINQSLRGSLRTRCSDFGFTMCSLVCSTVSCLYMLGVVSSANDQSDTEFEYSLLPLFLKLYEFACNQKIGWNVCSDDDVTMIFHAMMGKVFRAVVRMVRCTYRSSKQLCCVLIFLFCAHIQVIVVEFTYRLFVPSDLRAYYLSDKLTNYTFTSVGLRLFGMTVAAVAVVYHCHKLKDKSTGMLILYGFACYLLLWLPGLGLVSHGASQLGADRYAYLPLAYLVPGIACLLESPCAITSGCNKKSHIYLSVLKLGLLLSSCFLVNIAQKHFVTHSSDFLLWSTCVMYVFL